MFGYILPNEAELSSTSKRKLNMYYCSLCINTKSIYGNVPRFFISYDTLLPLIIFDSMSYKKKQKHISNCIVHPFTLFETYQNQILNYVTDINILLMYYKLLDDIKDEDNLKYKLKYLLLRKHKNNIQHKYLNKIFEENLHQLSNMENSKVLYSLDTLSHPLGRLMGEIFENIPCKINKDSIRIRYYLYNLGYNIGKWVYLIDALDDIEDDLKSKSFNPFINSTFDIYCNQGKIKTLTNASMFRFQIKKERISIILYNLIDNSYNAYKKLNLKDNKDLTENFLSVSLKNITTNILNKK